MSWQNAIERTVTGQGYALVDLERSAGGLLRVTIDRVPGQAYATGASEFVLVEDCEAVTRQLQYVLEVESCDYTRLEVSSPGLDRPLRSEADYQRFAGSAIELTLKLPLAGRKKFKGVLSPREGGWRLALEAPPASATSKAPRATRTVKSAKAAEPVQALDFVFNEVRDARLVPVIDFKGRKAGQPAAAAVSE
jgi:ribosome maturation factor RimP